MAAAVRQLKAQKNKEANDKANEIVAARRLQGNQDDDGAQHQAMYPLERQKTKIGVLATAVKFGMHRNLGDDGQADEGGSSSAMSMSAAQVAPNQGADSVGRMKTVAALAGAPNRRSSTGEEQGGAAHALPGANRRSSTDNIEPKPRGFFQYQKQVRDIYDASYCQWFVASLIIVNFICNVIEKEIDPSKPQLYKQTVWRPMEHAFNAIFLVELIVNAYSHWFKAFINSWNMFDCVVVSVGVASFFMELAGPLKLLRCLRAFRVFRLFKRIKSLNKILVMIINAVPGVSNAFLVMILSVSIYALIGVEFFSSFGTLNITEVELMEGIDLSEFRGPKAKGALDGDTMCGYINIDGTLVRAESSREMCYGDEYYGSFTRAWFTLFQVLTGESWSEVVARPALFGWNQYGGLSVWLSTIYYISFVLVNAFILFNVFVAVLLEKMMSPDVEAEDIADRILEGEDLSKDHATDLGSMHLPVPATSHPAEMTPVQPLDSSEQIQDTLVQLLNMQQALHDEQTKTREMLSTVLQRVTALEATVQEQSAR